MNEPTRNFKPGDRVRKTGGATGTVATIPFYYERAQGHPFTGWAVIIEPDEDPYIALTRIERGRKPSREYARLEGLVFVSDSLE